MRPRSPSRKAVLLIVVGLTALAWTWWPVPRREGAAALAPQASGAPHLEARWDVPERLRRGESSRLELRLARPAEAASPAAQTSEPARLRLTLERSGLSATPEAPLEIALLPGESVTITWQVRAQAEASARWALEWRSGSQSLPVWLHTESWPVVSLFGLPVSVTRALGSTLIAVGLLLGWLDTRANR
jgi:hypothetical protein